MLLVLLNYNYSLLSTGVLYNYDLKLCFNIFHGFSALTFSDFFSLPNSTNLRGHSLRLAVPLAMNNIRKQFFAVKIVPIWNSLPDSLVTSSTTSLFKSRLAKHNHIHLPHPAIIFCQSLTFACIYCI